MVYQIAIFQGDVLGLNATLQNMQLSDLSEIVDVVMISDNNYLIKFRMQQQYTSWWNKFLNNF